jgi:hypothetical protein
VDALQYLPWPWRGTGILAGNGQDLPGLPWEGSTVMLPRPSELEDRLTRIEGMLAMLIRRTADTEILDEATAKAYRRGYLAGHHAQRRGDPCDPDQALTARRHVA